MKIFVVLVLALACISAAFIPETPVAIKDAKRSNVIEGRIINGFQADPGAFPYQVGLSLKLKNEWFTCGGSLIGKSWILTAAHCTDGIESVIVYLGSTVKNEGSIVYNVSSSSVIQHTEFNPKTFENDLSLIKIPEVTFTDRIKSMRLPAFSKKHPTYANEYGTASGWGQTSDNNEYPSDLRYGYLYVLENDKCAETYGNKMITENKLCVDPSQGESTCIGDSGGPLVAGCELIGVASFVSAAGCQSGPAGFTRVNSYLDWIKMHTGISY